MAENLPTMWKARGSILSSGSGEKHSHIKENKTPAGILTSAFLTKWERQQSLCLNSNMALLDRTAETWYTLLVGHTLQFTAFTESV